MKQQPPVQTSIDLENTTGMETPEGNKIFQQGVILRRVSKFVLGAEEDGLMPIPVFFDPSTGKIVGDTLPKELREEYKDQMI
jgi:hypothetical protein